MAAFAVICFAAAELAHLLIEKQSGRLDCPALVVLPTSLAGQLRYIRERWRGLLGDALERLIEQANERSGRALERALRSAGDGETEP